MGKSAAVDRQEKEKHKAADDQGQAASRWLGPVNLAGFLLLAVVCIGGN
jgi:hypothetical protein